MRKESRLRPKWPQIAPWAKAFSPKPLQRLAMPDGSAFGKRLLPRGLLSFAQSDSVVLILLLFFPLLLFSVPYPPLRGPVEPYISGDTFRARCDHAYDEITRFIPHLVKQGETVFINGDLLGEFFSRHHPWIRFPYILISHNTDCAIPGPYASYLDDPKILAWFTQNPDGTLHPKLHPLPIGVENRHWKRRNVETIAAINALHLPKTHLLYCNFNAKTYPLERNLVEALFANAPFTLYQRRVNQEESFEPYIREIASSQFVLAPRGNGLDTHRLWETLYMGSYPIIKTSSLDPLLEGLPVVIVADWNDVTEEFLHSKYEEFQKKTFNLEKLYTNFWFQWIDSYK